MALRHVKLFGRDFDLTVSRADTKLNVQVTQNGRAILIRAVEPSQSADVTFPSK